MGLWHGRNSLKTTSGDVGVRGERSSSSVRMDAGVSIGREG